MKKFFFDLDQESEASNQDISIHEMFKDEVFALSKDNDGYIKKLREQLDMLEKI